MVCVFRLGEGYELLDSLDGANEGTGGRSVAYVYRKTSEGPSDALKLGALAARVQEHYRIE